MSKPKVLLQLDSDPHASSFDALVAIDAGVDTLLPYANVSPSEIQSIVHGAIFTRGPQDLKYTAIFVGGSNVSVGEALLKEVEGSFFGPLRVSALLDANGANTTAAAAVVVVERHVELRGSTAVVLGATGPVGQRVVRLLAGAGAHVRVASRQQNRAAEACDSVRKTLPDADLTPLEVCNDEQLTEALADARVVVAAGAAGIVLLPKEVRQACSTLEVAIDLNAVPPLGIEGIDVMDKATQRDGVLAYGAIGVGGFKMKIHKAAIHRLFESNDLILDAEQVFELGRKLEHANK
jgi:hypothetical protein